MRKIVYACFCLLILTGCATSGHAPEKPEVPDAAGRAIKMLRTGNERFVCGLKTDFPFAEQRRDTAKYGQHPFAVVLSCSDSRVPPEIIFQQGLGALFVVRGAGNVSSLSAAGSIEYGLEHLHAPLLVILGHSRCGAVSAVVAGTELPGNIPALVAPILPVVREVKARNPNAGEAELVEKSVRKNVTQAMKDLCSLSPMLLDMIKSKRIKAIGAVYNIENGTVEWFDVTP